MKKSVLLFLLVSALAFGQNQRFVYEYSFRTDSTEVEKPMEKEIMLLDVAKKGSKFFSELRYIADSTLAARQKNNPQNSDYGGIKWGKIMFTVEKKYPSFDVSFFTYLDANEYEVKETRKPEWKISAEKSRIGEYEVQKATTTFLGRKWNAWFAPEIPIQDGPYKFHGLPGMILKIADVQNSHIFELKAIQKLPPGTEWESAAQKSGRFRKLISVDEKQYRKLFLENRENPTKGIRQMLASGVLVKMTDDKGNVIDIEKDLREQERNVKENNRRNNNLLELDLLTNK